jgi:hypothetical protein
MDRVVNSKCFQIEDLSFERGPWKECFKLKTSLFLAGTMDHG